MKAYLDLIRDILKNGTYKDDRTGTGTTSKFGAQMRFDLSKGFPLVTTKKVYTRGIIHELLWFIAGDTNIKYLVENKVNIWNEWPYKSFEESDDFNGETLEEFKELILTDDSFSKKHGDLGPVYGKQWRDFNGVDQLSNVIDMIKNNPTSRRIILSAWNPSEIESMALPPCHTLVQFYVREGKLSCQLYQRSADVFLGVPFNIASYALLTHMLAQTSGLDVGDFVHSFGDAHIYSNHMEQVNLQLSRDTKELPTLKLNKDVKSIFNYTIDDIEIIGYESHPTIKGKVAV